jgi:hypothetical protein
VPITPSIGLPNYCPGICFQLERHNFQIARTIGNETESLNLDWQPLESKLLAAVAYVSEKRVLYLRFHGGELHRYFTFPAEQNQEFLETESQSRYFLSHIRNHSPYERLGRS